MPTFAVRYTIHGEASDIIEAESQEQADAIIQALVEGDDFDPSLDSIDDVSWHVQPMHSVIRDGKAIKTTRPLATDIPSIEGAA